MKFTGFLATSMALFCLSTPSFGTEKIQVERISLDQALAEIGYTSSTYEGIPINDPADIVFTKDGLSKVPKFQYTRSEYPFSGGIAVNSRLDMMAAALDSRAFANNKEVNRKVGLFTFGPELELIPSLPKVTAKVLSFPGGHVGSVKFIGEDLLRVGMTSTNNRQVQPHTYHLQYYFKNLTSNDEYDLADELPFFNVLHVRHFSDTVYLVADLPEGKKKVSDIRYSLVHYNPLNRKHKILTEFDSAIGSDLLHSPVDLPHRDVYRFGSERVSILFSVSRNQSGWVPHHLRVDTRDLARPKVDLEVGAHLRDQSRNWIEGMAPEVATQEKLKFQFPQYSTLRYFPSGMVAAVGNHPDYQHYVAQNGSTTIEHALTTRLISADYKDGGFAGVAFSRGTSENHFIRVVYDSAALNASVVPVPCDDLLGNFLSQKKKSK